MSQSADKGKLFFENAEEYRKIGDVYNAVKLYKLAIRYRSDFFDPYQRLSAIYKQRADWKAAMYYTKKALALQSADQQLWWDLGIAATALGKRRLAGAVWQKFGWSSPGQKPLSVKLRWQDQEEILWSQPLGPATVQLLSIPHPQSEHRFGDRLLVDRKDIVGYHIANQRRHPIFPKLDTLKRSNYRTYSCYIDTCAKAATDKLAELCRAEKLGFEIWSNANLHSQTTQQTQTPEYYDSFTPQEHQLEALLIAVACSNSRQVKRVLDAWQVITFHQYFDLVCHH